MKAWQQVTTRRRKTRTGPILLQVTLVWKQEILRPTRRQIRASTSRRNYFSLNKLVIPTFVAKSSPFSTRPFPIGTTSTNSREKSLVAMSTCDLWICRHGVPNQHLTQQETRRLHTWASYALVKLSDLNQLVTEYSDADVEQVLL